jgi:phenylacetate 2-hydroxylase
MAIFSNMDVLREVYDNSHFLMFLAASSIVTYLLVLIYRQAFSTDIPHIPGLPEPSGARPFYGHLNVLGCDHPSKFEEWSVKNNWPVIQAKFGTRRVVVLNTFQAAQEFIVKNATATIDRPLFWTFHKILSTTQGRPDRASYA